MSDCVHFSLLAKSMMVFFEHSVAKLVHCPQRFCKFICSAALLDDLGKTHFVQDSNLAGCHKAEQYHQFHNGIGIPFGPDYTKKQKQIAQRNKRIGPTGCPELGGLFG